MNKRDVIARRILGWKLNRWDRWFDFEKGTFIHESDFHPEQNLEHAMLIVERLEHLGFTYTEKEDIEVCFNNDFNKVCETGDTLAQAITNAAYALADDSSLADAWL
jgi:hypothetical protein